MKLSKNNGMELYNLAEDPCEKNNVAEKYPEIVQMIDTYLSGARTESEFWPI